MVAKEIKRVAKRGKYAEWPPVVHFYSENVYCNSYLIRVGR